MGKQTNTSKTANINGWFLNEPFNQSMVYQQLTNMKYTHVLGLDIGHGETVVYLSALKAVKKPDGKKNAEPEIEAEIRKVPVNKEGDSRIATMIGFVGEKVIIGSKAGKAPEFYQHFKVVPALWGKNYRTKTFRQLMQAFIRELWNGIIRFNPVVENVAQEGKLLIAVGCPSSPDWTNAKAVEDYRKLITEATGCKNVTVLAESTAAIMSAVLDVNEIAIPGVHNIENYMAAIAVVEGLVKTYKMEKATASAWIGKVVEFIHKGENKCYAENALNEIFPALNVRAFSYENYYIDEIDNLDDHARVTAEILPFDEADAKIFG